MFGFVKNIMVYLSVLLLVVFLLSLSGVKLHQLGDAMINLSRGLAENEALSGFHNWANRTLPNWGQNFRQNMKKYQTNDKLKSPVKPTAKAKKRQPVGNQPPQEKITEAERRELEELFPE